MSPPSENPDASGAWVVTVDEPVWYGRLYVRLIERLPHRIHGVLLLPAPHGASLRAFAREAWYRLRFWGLAGFLRGGLRLVNARLSASGDVARAARAHGIPVHKLAKLHDITERLTVNPPRAVLATVTSRVPRDLIEMVPGGWVNTHCGPLPRYAGMDAPFWCLYHGEPEVTVTLHYMDPDFDCGPIIAQSTLPVEKPYYFEIVDQLFDEAFALHLAYLESFEPSPRKARPQQLDDRTYFSKPAPVLGREFRRKGGVFA